MKHVEAPIIVLMGPTASGKSAMGMVLAQMLGGVIINADAMQCYADLPILTARPSAADVAQVPHRLYGMWGWNVHGNAALWREEAVREVRAVLAGGQVPILVGGTGMYIRTLMEGIAPVPEISEGVKLRVRAWGGTPHPNPLPKGEGIRGVEAGLGEEPSPSGRGQGEGMAYPLYSQLQSRDPLMASRLKPGDTQRIIRALEVWEETGRSLADWQDVAVEPAFAREQFACYRVEIDRNTLYERINMRFGQMMEAGGLEEVRQVMATADDGILKKATHPLLKACGVPELMAHLRGEAGLEEAVSLAQQHSRNYAKRQMTWLRNQMPEAVAVPYNDPKAIDLMLPRLYD